jgi:sugar lactone lactonase YvrE
VWTSTYDDPAHVADDPNDVATSPDGGTVFVTGVVNGSASMTTVAYEAASGAQLWVATYVGPEGMGATGQAIAVSPDGTTVFVTGSVIRSLSNDDYVTVAYDAATGTQQWASLYDGPGHGDDSPNAIDVSRDGARVVVTGGSEKAPLKSGDYATVAYDATTGAQLWATRYDAIGGFDEAYDVAFDPAGTTVFVTGGAYVAQRPYDTDYRTLAYDAATGTQLWVADYEGPGGFNNSFDTPNAMAVSPDGSALFVTGHSDGPSQAADDYATVAYATDSGAQLWVSRYDGAAHGFDFANDIAVAPDGTRVFVTGDSYGATGNQDFATVAYDSADGAQVWVTRFDGGGNWDQSPKLAVAPDGARVLIAGISDAPGTPGNGFATFAYDASTGAKQWGAIIGFRHSATADAMAMSPDGSMMFVTGSWLSTLDNADYGTVAYQLG